MRRITITPRRIDVRGHGPMLWCVPVSTVLQMLRGADRALLWQDSASERRNHYVLRRRPDDLDRKARRRAWRSLQQIERARREREARITTGDPPCTT